MIGRKKAMKPMRRLSNIILNIFHWLCTIVGALVIVSLLTWLLRSCYYNHKPESVLYGNWSKVDSEDGYNDHVLTFDWNGEYYNSNTGSEAWNYKFIEPDSLILYPYVLYEERYKILNLSEDTLIVRLSESIVNLSENGKDIEAPYGDGSMPIFTYIRINHKTTPEY